jgi:hypothetical protein
MLGAAESGSITKRLNNTAAGLKHPGDAQKPPCALIPRLREPSPALEMC